MSLGFRGAAGAPSWFPFSTRNEETKIERERERDKKKKTSLLPGTSTTVPKRPFLLIGPSIFGAAGGGGFEAFVIIKPKIHETLTTCVVFFVFLLVRKKSKTPPQPLKKLHTPKNKKKQKKNTFLAAGSSAPLLTIINEVVHLRTALMMNLKTKPKRIDSKTRSKNPKPLVKNSVKKLGKRNQPSAAIVARHAERVGEIEMMK